MRRETKPQGSGGSKPLRARETLRADGVGQVSQRADHLSWFRRKETNHREGTVFFLLRVSRALTAERQRAGREASFGMSPLSDSSEKRAFEAPAWHSSATGADAR